MLRAVRLWLLHLLAFVVGQIVSGVAVYGALSMGDWVTRDGSGLLWRVLAAAVGSLALGYLVWLWVICRIADVLPGRALYLWGPLVVLSVTALVVGAVYHGLATSTGAGVAGYVILFLSGGLWLTLGAEGTE